METNGRKGKKIIAWIIVFVVLAAAAGLYIFQANQYEDRFLPGTMINGVNVGNKTVAKAEKIFAEPEEGYNLELVFQSGQRERINGSAVGYVCRLDGYVDKIAKGQNKYTWLLGMLHLTSEQFDVPAEYSKVLLLENVLQLPEMKEENMAASVDAHVDFVDGSFRVVPEYYGNTLDEKVVLKAIMNAMSKGKTTLDINKISGAYEMPAVLSDDPALQKRADQLNEFSFGSITYQLPGGASMVLDGHTLKDWLVTGNDGAPYNDENVWNARLSEFVSKLAEVANTTERAHKFITSHGTLITVPGTSYYGWQVDTEKELKWLTAELEKSKTVVREPAYKTEECGTDAYNYGIGDNYVEIDLGNQHLWIYKDRKMVFETDVVSGKNNGHAKTPDGMYRAYDKQKDRILRGDVQTDGTFGYESFVKYWIRVTQTGIGLHDASWRGAFGGEIWKYSGSHGCINLPVSAAPIIYDLVDDGMPIIIYYYDSEAAIPVDGAVNRDLMTEEEKAAEKDATEASDANKAEETKADGANTEGQPAADTAGAAAGSREKAGRAEKKN